MAKYSKRDLANFEANRQYLARISSQHGIQIKAESPGYAATLAHGLRAQEAAGVPLSVQAARRHRVTPEHGPRGARPRLPAPVTSYGPPPKSKYVKRTQPLRHKRPRIAKLVEFDGGVVYTEREETQVWANLAQWKDNDRVILSGFDCSTGHWAQIMTNTQGTKAFHKPQPGVTIGFLREQVARSGMSLEDFMVLWTLHDSPYGGNQLTHVCLFQIHVYPRETQQMQEIARRVKRLAR